MANNEKCDICSFVENILHIDLCNYEKLLLKKLMDAKNRGEKLIYIEPHYNSPDLENIVEKYFNYINSTSDKYNSKNIKTRIKLKQDKLENWSNTSSNIHGSFDI